MYSSICCLLFCSRIDWYSLCSSFSFSLSLSLFPSSLSLPLFTLTLSYSSLGSPKTAKKNFIISWVLSSWAWHPLLYGCSCKRTGHTRSGLDCPVWPAWRPQRVHSSSGTYGSGRWAWSCPPLPVTRGARFFEVSKACQGNEGGGGRGREGEREGGEKVYPCLFSHTHTHTHTQHTNKHAPQVPLNEYEFANKKLSNVQSQVSRNCYNNMTLLTC